MASFEKGLQLYLGFLLVHDGVADVGPVKAGDVAFGLLQVKSGQDIGLGLTFGCGCKGDQRDIREKAAQAAELHVFWAEIVAPL